MTVPTQIKHFTADTVAECFPLNKAAGGAFGQETPEARALYLKLWDFVNDAKTPTPRGGDGDDGTVETPDGQIGDEFDDQAGHFWAKLTEADRELIAKAYKLDYGEALDGYGEDEEPETED